MLITVNRCACAHANNLAKQKKETDAQPKRRVDRIDESSSSAAMNPLTVAIQVLVCGCLLLLLLVVPPLALLVTEHELYELYRAVEAEQGSILHLSSPAAQPLSALLDQVVHFTAAGVHGSTADRAFAVRVLGGLQLRRRTEYCQWAEARTVTCEQCEVRDTHGTVKRESCNCKVRTGSSQAPFLRRLKQVEASPPS